MEPLSIATACLSLAGTVAKVSQSIRTFVRTAREARSDLDLVSRELHSLQIVLELLAEDTEETPKAIPLEKQIGGIVEFCNSVVQDIAKVLQKHEKGKLTGIKWALSGRDDVARLKSMLEAQKSALEIVLEMVNLYAPFGYNLAVLS